MTFKWKIGHAPLECEFETGSIGEAIEILSNESSQLAQVFALGPAAIGVGDAPQQQDAPNAEAPKRRGRKPATQPDPSTASAPPPAPIPAAPPAPAAPPPAPVSSSAPAAPSSSGDGLEIPTFLQRTAAPAAPAPAAPPPPMPAAPPIAPPAPVAAPPVGVLGPKIIDAITKQKQGDGATWVKWLSDSGLVIAGCTFDEAMECLLYTADEKLLTAAAQLQISASG